jgi:hypothetical protein
MAQIKAARPQAWSQATRPAGIARDLSSSWVLDIGTEFPVPWEQFSDADDAELGVLRKEVGTCEYRDVHCPAAWTTCCDITETRATAEKKMKHVTVVALKPISTITVALLGNPLDH